MFGTLKPSLPALDPVSRSAWQRLYCGTCQSLGEHFGHGYRGLLSHDAVFLAALVDGLQADPAGPDRCRCPMIPVVHRQTLQSSSVAMRYAASVQILLADQWLADRSVDRRSLARLARPLLRAPATHARRELAELGSSLAELEHFEQHQLAAELPGTTGPREAAEPTASALALVFERIAELPGGLVQAPAQTPLTRTWLARLGRAVGTVIYLVDALEDLERDLADGAFNPCLAHDFAGRSVLAPARVREASDMLRAALRELSELVELLPLRRHAGLLKNVLLVQLRGRVHQAIAEGKRMIESGPRSRWARLRDGLRALWQRKPVLRLTQALTAALVASVSVGFAKLAEAAPPKQKKGKRKPEPEPEKSETETDTETDTGDETDTDTDGESTSSSTGDETDTTGPELDADTTTGTPDIEPGTGEGCPCCTWFSDCMQDFCGSLGGACGECGESVGACGGCFAQSGECCSGCGDGVGSMCSECGQGCGSCNSACKDCGNCGDCGNACSGCGDCGNACSGCGDCGNCCNGCGDCGNACNGCGDCGNCGNCGGGGGGNCC